MVDGPVRHRREKSPSFSYMFKLFFKKKVFFSKFNMEQLDTGMFFLFSFIMNSPSYERKKLDSILVFTLYLSVSFWKQVKGWHFRIEEKIFKIFHVQKKYYIGNFRHIFFLDLHILLAGICPCCFRLDIDWVRVHRAWLIPLLTSSFSSSSSWFVLLCSHLHPSTCFGLCLLNCSKMACASFLWLSLSLFSSSPGHPCRTLFSFRGTGL